MSLYSLFALALGASLTGGEVYAIYDALRDSTGAQMVMGISASIATPAVGLYATGKHAWLGYLSFVLLLLAVLVLSGARVGQGIDRAEQKRASASRTSSAVADIAAELKTALEDAKATKKRACAKDKEQTKACKEATTAAGIALAKYVAAGTTLAETPVAAGEGDVVRVAAWFHASQEQVRLYLPLLWPCSIAVAGAFFWGKAGEGWQRKPEANAPAGGNAHAIPPATSLNAVRVLRQIVQPAGPRHRVEVGEVRRAYVEACRRADAEIAPVEVFGPQAKQFADAAEPVEGRMGP